MSTLRLAVPLFGDEVAPRFCFADQVLIADIAAGAVASSQRLSMGDASWPQRLSELAAAGVSVLLCGGFNRRFLPLASSHGIEVIWGLFGGADRVVQAFCTGELGRLQLRSKPDACAGRGAHGEPGLGRGPGWGRRRGRKEN